MDEKALSRRSLLKKGAAAAAAGAGACGSCYQCLRGRADLCQPRFVELLDKGQYNAKLLATTVVPIDRMREAYEEVAYRTTVTAIMTG